VLKGTVSRDFLLLVFSRIAAGFNDTGGKFATRINDTGGKFATGVKFETALMVYSGDWGKLIHEKKSEAENLATLSL
jgi:hypothetical protein